MIYKNTVLLLFVGPLRASNNATQRAGPRTHWISARASAISTRSPCSIASASSFVSSRMRLTRSAHRSAPGIVGVSKIGAWNRRWKAATAAKQSGCPNEASPPPPPPAAAAAVTSPAPAPALDIVFVVFVVVVAAAVAVPVVGVGVRDVIVVVFVGVVDTSYIPHPTTHPSMALLLVLQLILLPIPSRSVGNERGWSGPALHTHDIRTAFTK